MHYLLPWLMVLSLALLPLQPAAATDPEYATVVDEIVLGAGLHNGGRVWMLAYTQYPEPEMPGCGTGACASLLLIDRASDRIVVRMGWSIVREAHAFGLGAGRVGVVFEASDSTLPQSQVGAFEPVAASRQYLVVVDAAAGTVLHSTYLPAGFVNARGLGVGADIVLIGTQAPCTPRCAPDGRALRILRFDADLRVLRFDRADFDAGSPHDAVANGSGIQITATFAAATPGAAMTAPPVPQGGVGLLGIDAATGELHYRSFVGRLGSIALRRDPFARGTWIFGTTATDGFPVTSHAAYRRCGDTEGCRTTVDLSAFGAQYVYAPGDVVLALLSGDGTRFEYATYAGIDGSAIAVNLIPGMDRVRLMVGTAAPQVSFSGIERTLETFEFALDRPSRESIGAGAWATGLRLAPTFVGNDYGSQSAGLWRENERTQTAVLRGSNGLAPACVHDGTETTLSWCRLIALWPATSQGSSIEAIPMLSLRGGLLLAALTALTPWAGARVVRSDR